jgi:Flavin-binding monooxygenase-like
VSPVDRSNKICVIGAGASGLTVAKNLRQMGQPFDCLERQDDIGGNWYYGRPASSVYQSTHLISSKRLTEFRDFPMPDEYPAFPSHDEVRRYFQDYARAFDLYAHIEFKQWVERVEPVDGESCWDVTLADGSTRRYRGVVIANGHHWDPKFPQYPGQFSGQALHSSQYKTPDVLRGQRVLVIGAGNSGCDIAVEAAQNAVATFHSTRRGYHYLPKFLLGKPIDVCGERMLKWRLPLGLRRWITDRLVKLALGRPQDYGLPAPDHRLFETHPIINSQMLYFVGHGKIRPKPDVREFAGPTVRFIDGSQEDIDLIVYATGYHISFPFIDRVHLNWQGDRPELLLNVFHPRHERLFVAGLIQPDSGLWGLVDDQAQLIARYLWSLDHAPERARWFDGLKAAPPPDLSSGIGYVKSERHLLEVEHFSYGRRLQGLLKELG